MRRPMFTVALCLVIICAIRLWTGGAENEQDSCVTVTSLEESGTLTIIGQVYQKEEDSLYLKSIIISDSNAFGQSVAESRQVNSSYKKQEDVAMSSGQGKFTYETLSGNLICEMDGAMQIPLGTTVLVQGNFVGISGATNPGEFDARKYYRSIGIVGKMEAVSVLEQGEDYWPVREWLYGVKLWLSERIYRTFPEEDAAVIEALLLGEKSNLDSELEDLYQRNGILHILSISAMHVSIVGMSIYQLLRKVGAPIWLSALCGSAILLLYGALTGFGISAVRAIGMYLIRMFGEVVGRTYDMLTALGLVGALMVLYNPYYLQNGGFLLSFSCVLGIGVLYPLLLPDFRRYMGKNRALDTPWKKLLERLQEAELPKQVIRSFVLSLSVTLATLPVQLYLYYEIPTFSVFLNLLVVPFLKPLMISGMVALVLPWSVVFEGVASTILGWYEWACQCFDVLPYNTWNPGCPEEWKMMGYYGLLLGVILWRRAVKAREKRTGELGQRVSAREKKRGVAQRVAVQGKEMKGVGHYVQELHILGCVAMLCLGIGILGHHPLQSSVTFLDVGQGSCAVMRLSSGENYLFDCGSTSRSKVGQYVLLPYLKYAGIKRLDGVFVSHPDEDHSNGVLELFAMAGENDIVIEQLILPDVEDEASVEQLGELVNKAEELKQDSEGILPWGFRRIGGKDLLQVDEQGNRQGIRVAYISRGDSWQCESASFLCLHPYKDYSGADSNQYSQCIYVEFKEKKLFGEAATQTLLLTGDVGKAAEVDLVDALEEYGIQKIAVLQGAHHGSKYSNSEELLDAVQPTVTVISCGRNNSYGHPHEETLERLEAVGSAVLTTPEYGAVTVEFGRRLIVRGWALPH